MTTAHAEAALDLVCGPEGPLPESVQRYRLVQHLGSGGQADVYRGVRLCGGVASAPVTVKIFRPDPSRALADQLRSWDKGDAALMDLNSRGTEGLCRRVDGFYGVPPHPPAQSPAGELIPYQVLDYLSGWTLREHLAAGVAPRLDAAAVLRGLAGTLLSLHRPDRATDCPVLHMDVKPSNLIVLPDGRVRLIDFTSARYDRRDHITSVAFTAEASAPEAFTGQVSSAYDVHGFGAVAYFVVTGAHPRSEAEIPDPVYPDAPVAPWAVLRHHPELDRYPALRDHLLAPLADRPADRPRTDELAGWVDRLATLAARVPFARRLVNWGDETSVMPQASGPALGRVPVPGAAPDRLARLEQEVVELRALVRPAPEATRVEPVPARALGRAPVTRQLPAEPTWREVVPAAPPAPAPPGPQPAAAPHSGPRRGRFLTTMGVTVLLICWLVWSAFTLVHGAPVTQPALGLVLGLGAVAGAFWLSRLMGRLVLRSRQRAGALPSHLVATGIAVLLGVTLLSVTPFSLSPVTDLLRTLLPF